MSGGIFGIWQWLVVGLIVVLLFARPGKISGLMGDFGKGLSIFRKGMKDEGNDKKHIEEEVTDTTDKNKSTTPDKIEIKKFDPVARKRVTYKEEKIK